VLTLAPYRHFRKFSIWVRDDSLRRPADWPLNIDSARLFCPVCAFTMRSSKHTGSLRGKSGSSEPSLYIKGDVLVCGGNDHVLLRDQRAEREKLVTTGVATQRWEAQETTQEGGPAGNVFGGDSLQVGVAAVGAVRVKGETKRNGTRVEARFADFTAPGQNFRTAEKIVH
jgi:hypothetical protein